MIIRARKEYIEDVRAKADAAAALADRLSVGYIKHWHELCQEDRASLMEAMCLAGQQRDVYRQQVDFYEGRTNYAAWVD